ncbi:MAG: glutathione S-transferase family protein [Actinomycetota bacterium]|nr:glutathione S-transferase family protein [Actinomycetota bacterium]
MLTLYDAARCPYCARVRIVLREKGVAYEPVEIDLESRPASLYAKNPNGRVPVLVDDDGLVLPESRVIMEYLDERFPEPALMPVDPAERALVRLAFERFGDIAEPYYDVLRGAPGGSRERLVDELARLDVRLASTPYLAGETYSLADAAYCPWILRTEARLGVEVRHFPALASWLGRLEERPAVAPEIELARLARRHAA